MKKGDIYVVELLSIINTYFNNLRLRPIPSFHQEPPWNKPCTDLYLFNQNIHLNPFQIWTSTQYFYAGGNLKLLVAIKVYYQQMMRGRSL